MPKDEQATRGAALLTLTQAAEELGLSRSAIYTLRDSGQLAVARVLGRPAILRAELDRYLGTLAAEAEAARQAAAAPRAGRGRGARGTDHARA